MLYINDRIDSLTPIEIEKAIEQLPLWRRAVAQRQRQEIGRRQSLLVYELLCEGLKKDFQIDLPPRFEIAAHGKPYLPDYPQIHFNLSHCSQAVACAIDTCPVGIDIETYRLPSHNTLRYAMNEEEILNIMQSTQPKRTFTTLWTQKEAIVKLSGKGISQDIRDILYTNTSLLHTILTERYACTLAIAT